MTNATNNRPTAFKAAKALAAETGTSIAAKTFGLRYNEALKEVARTGNTADSRYWAACYRAASRLAMREVFGTTV